MSTLLPPRIPKKAKRASRWRSQAHCNHVRGFACAMCFSKTNVIPAHYRFGSGAGMGEKPDDFLTTPLCDGPYSNIDGELGCHQVQHAIGEPAFWERYEKRHGQTVIQLIEGLIETSPRRAQIQQIRREREG